jgi:hypothetical protein
VAGEQRRRRLLPDALGPRDPVGGVAAQRDEVGHERRRHAVAALDLGRVDDLGALAAGAHVENAHALAGALVEVAVAGHDERAAAGVGLAPRVGAEQVVGLEVLAGGHGPAKGAEEARGGGELL